MTSSARCSLLVLAAFLGALFLLNAFPAAAQTTIWSGTLTVKTLDVGVGCLNTLPGAECTAALTNDDFTHNSVDYQIVRIRQRSVVGGQIRVDLNKNVPSSFSDYKLRVGGSDFAVTSISGMQITVDNTGQSWSANDSVSLSLIEPPPTTVTLSVSPNPVGEGSTATATVKLSRALSSAVTIPVTATAGSAESGDYTSSVSSVTIAAGNVEGTAGTIRANQDTDEDDETLTVALGTLPSSLVAGTPSSVEITIRDDDGLRLSVDANPPCGSEVTNAVQPSFQYVLTPTPAGNVYAEYRVVTETSTLPWVTGSSLPIPPGSGRSPSFSFATFADLRRAYPGFKGFDFRLRDTPSVMAPQCTWTFTEDPVPPTVTPAPPTGGVPPTGGGPSPGGGAPLSAEPSDPTPDSDTPARCGESDREYLERFYQDTGGDAWDRSENWNSQEPLDEWFGVKTDEDGEVISLRLEDNNLSGDMPTEELLCLNENNENTELKELALWDNEDLLGDVPDELALAVERAALRTIAEMLDINPEWFEDYEDPFNFEDWHEGVTTDDNGRVTGLDLPGEIPESIRSQFKKREITITTSDGGCALSPEGSSAFGLFFLTLFVFAVLGRKRVR